MVVVAVVATVLTHRPAAAAAGVEVAAVDLNGEQRELRVGRVTQDFGVLRHPALRQRRPAVSALPPSPGAVVSMTTGHVGTFDVPPHRFAALNCPYSFCKTRRWGS